MLSQPPEFRCNLLPAWPPRKGMPAVLTSRAKVFYRAPATVVHPAIWLLTLPIRPHFAEAQISFE